MANQTGERFVCVHAQGGAFSREHVEILVDRMTGVQYLWRDISRGGNAFAGGFTVLLDQDGKTLLYQASN